MTWPIHDTRGANIPALTFQHLHKRHAGLLVDLSRALSSVDESPCSFWGINDTNAQEWIEEQDRLVVVGLAKSAIASIGALRVGGRHQEHLAEVSVAVHPEYRRDGFARLTVSELETRAANLGVELIKALVWVENHPSRRLFEAIGYEHKATLIAEFKSDEIGEIDDAVYYKRL